MGVRNTLILGGVLSVAVYVHSEPILSMSPVARAGSQLPVLPNYQLDSKIAHYLGPYGARYAVPSKISSEVPKGCNVTMINILQRHDARYPTKDSGAEIDTALAKLKGVTNINEPSLKFISTFNYTYVADQLNDFGRKQSYISGQIIAKKYASLGTAKFVRAAQKPRIVESARWWKQGFQGAVFDVPIASLPQPDVSIIISDTSNNTLNVQTCKSAEAIDPAPGDIASGDWLGRFAPPITKRLNKLLPGAGLNDNDTINLMSLCGFDTAANNGNPSPWCAAFDQSVWKNYEYYYDLEKYYSKSYGSAYARSQGSGWVNELLSRLTDTPVQDQTTTNNTLDSNPATFPIGPSAPRIYADFSSDNNIAMILSALGILRDAKPLPPAGPIPSSSTQQFVVSKLVPFAGSTVVEKLSCPALPEKEYVRIIINDAVIPLTDLAPCGKLGATQGLCALGKFVESQAEMNPVKYAPLAVQDSKDLECCEQHEQLEEENSRWHSLIVDQCKPIKAFRNALIVGCGILFLGAYAFSESPHHKTHPGQRHEGDLPALPTYHLDRKLIEHLGPYGPRHAVPSKISSDTPEGCSVSMISILQRHGARYPTGDGEGARIEAALNKLSRVTSTTDPSLEFALDFKYPYMADQMVLFGQKQMYVSGQIIAKKYASLGSKAFVRSTKEERIAESAGWWEQGFKGALFDVPTSELPYPAVAMPVSDKFNNTLDVQTCPAAKALNPPLGDTASAEWLATFAPPITNRLNDRLPGANLTDRDVFSLMNLCGFDSAAKNGAASPWCGAFSLDEWKSYEYYHDLEKYWSKSYGSAYARSLGAGWVNELLSRLTGNPVQDSTSTNSTLDSDHKTFPIGSCAPRIFADFSSDNNIATILASLGILRDSAPLPSTGPIPSSETQQFVVSRMVPFGGLTLVEKLSCSGPDLNGDYVRVLVNDAVISMDILPECTGSDKMNGLCRLDKFVQSQAYARQGGNFTACFQ
ncbi:unnamed protein product [Rhizoctonia solani]|uniref:3-phytase A n=1 Tax=Rhizoctonia solani TaxID=456999 RepID=A0A8H3G9H0_9AGAM|nr:unnamed protein product [Rhizoctonia solani]